jgi:beta-lactamase superfamily II metal-dependent hydrolase
MLVDAGPPQSYEGSVRSRLLALDDRRIDLFVVTHIDADHIGGAVALLGDDDLKELHFGDIWFNARNHLDDRAAQQGEDLAAALLGRGGRPLPWNVAFGGVKKAVVTDGPGTWRTLYPAPGVEIVLLSPTPQKLAQLAPTWDREMLRLRAGEGSPEDTSPVTRARVEGPDAVLQLAQERSTWDRREPNGSSIAFLLRYAGRTALFAADAHIDPLGAALEAYAGEGHRLPIDVFKLPHHGSDANLNTKLLDLVAADHYLVSTNSAKHPSPRAIARVVAWGSPRERGPARAGGHTIWFNYRTPQTAIWDRRDLESHFGHQTRFPEANADGCSLQFPGRCDTWASLEQLQ